MRVVSVVGARPQFIKLAVICRAISQTEPGSFCHRIVHTGQHYDTDMNDVFFEDLGIPAPDYNLDVGSGTHATQTAKMMTRLEPVLRDEGPDWVLLYGDTNSTLAGALVAAKLRLRVAHIEAGLRSYNRGMPEEVNRISADRISDLLLCPTSTAMSNLEREGLGEGAVLVGDVMYAAVLQYRELAEQRTSALAEHWKPDTFALATIHRAENTEDINRLAAILRALEYISRHICPVVLPLHPRTRNYMGRSGLSVEAVSAVKPLSYLEMLLLEGRA